MSLRVVSGTAGGRKLKVPKNVEIRPTQDRIKQAIFSSLGESVHGARVLDLYAGTGALGIEALSRGAAEALFVEKARATCRCIAENLAQCGLAPLGAVREMDALAFLRNPQADRFDLVFADPPYDKAAQPPPSPLPAALRPWMAPRGTWVWEYFTGCEIGPLSGWKSVFERQYGETTISILIAI